MPQDNKFLYQQLYTEIIIIFLCFKPFFLSSSNNLYNEMEGMVSEISLVLFFFSNLIFRLFPLN